MQKISYSNGTIFSCVKNNLPHPHYVTLTFASVELVVASFAPDLGLKVVDGLILLLLQCSELLMLNHQAVFWEGDPLDLAHQYVRLGQSDDGLDLGGGHQLLPQG